MASFIKPSVQVSGDKDGIMARSGDIVGVTKSRVVWRFGFMPASDDGLAHGCHSPEFLWVLFTHRGRILTTFKGFGLELPKRFKGIITGPV